MHGGMHYNVPMATMRCEKCNDQPVIPALARDHEKALHNDESTCYMDPFDLAPDGAPDIDGDY